MPITYLGFFLKWKKKKELFDLFRKNIYYILDILMFLMNFLNEDLLNDYQVIKIVQIQTLTLKEKKKVFIRKKK
jgi:hypothetical protein